MAVCKVPTNPTEALKSQLMGMMEKQRVVTLYKFINNVNPDDNKNINGISISPKKAFSIVGCISKIEENFPYCPECKNGPKNVLKCGL